MPALPALNYAPPPDGPAIVHADDALLIVEKPAGLLSVPGRDPAHRDSVQTRLAASHPESRLIHRLDMDTSGLMVFARTPAAQRHLGLQFERRHIHKTYHALVAGAPGEDQGHIDAPIRTDWPNRPLQMIHPEGRAAQTDWHLEAAGPPARLRLHPRTGRSHQLRLHLAHIGMPILGDRFYDGAAAPRLMLHASALGLRHPNGGAQVQFESPCPF